MSGPIDAYVTAVRRGLPGPARTSDGLVQELADGLHDAAEAYADAGVPRARAQDRAVRECGPVEEILPAYRIELAAAQARRTSMLLAVSLPATLLAWDALWEFAPPEVGPAPYAVGVLARIVDWANLVCASIALLVLAALVIGGRARTRVRPAIAVLLGIGAGTIVTVMGLSVAMNVLNAETISTGFTGPVGALGLASVCVATIQARSLWRSFRLTFSPLVRS